jgi:hypothetical protein
MCIRAGPLAPTIAADGYNGRTAAASAAGSVPLGAMPWSQPPVSS